MPYQAKSYLLNNINLITQEFKQNRNDFDVNWASTILNT